MTDELKDENINNEIEEDVTFEPETDGDQAMPQKDLALKVKELKAELTEANKQKQEYLDGWMRMKADIANIKKREEEERANFIKYAKEGVIEEMLPTLQNFDMAMANKEAWEKVDANWRAGIEYIAKQLRTTLEGHGLVEINPINLPFDITRDEALEHVAVTDEKQDNVILEVVQKGYKLHDKIIRAPRVKVGEFKA
jgi:molecular chaperone GrpE